MRLSYFYLCTFCLLPFILSAQYQEERIDDPYMPLPESERKTSAPFTIHSSNFFSTQVNLDANGMNILGDAANEPSMAIDPKNPNRIAIGWRQFDNVQSNFRQAGYAYSSDGGQTWEGQGTIEPGIFRSDPVLVSNANGRFYYNSLAVSDNGAGNEYDCYVHRADSLGEWDDGVYALGGDKQWMTIDRTGGIGHGNIYHNWNRFFSICPPHDYTRSVDGGDSYEACTSLPGGIRWGNIHVGSNGTVYAPSLNGTLAFSENAKNASEQTLWSIEYVDIGGFIEYSTGPNPAGLLGMVWVDSDYSTGPNAGNVYMAGAVSGQDINDEGEMMFNRSLDGGKTWGPPIKISDDGYYVGNWQWMSAMSVAPNGRIDCVWLDTRDNPGTYLSALYYSFSIDGGDTWSINEKLSDSFDPHVGWPNQNKMGDYFHMISDNEGANLAWCGTFNGEQDVYFGRISQNITPAHKINSNERFSFQNSPNPFTTKTIFSISRKEVMPYKLFIYNQLGQMVWEKEAIFGAYTLEWDGQTNTGIELGMGVYFAKIQFEDGSEKTIKISKK